MAIERTLILVKPDGFKRKLVGEIIARFENKGLNIVGLKAMKMARAVAEKHYGEHAAKPFFGELVDFITSGPLIAMAVEGPDAVKLARNLMGATKAVEALPGTIRGDFATTTGENLVHGSDSTESAARELALFFAPGELLA